MISVTDRAIIQPTCKAKTEISRDDAQSETNIVHTKTSVLPVAHGGMDARIGAKKIDIKKQVPVVMAVIPVLPPSVIPAADSMKAVTGDEPKSDPTEIEKASVE